LIADSPNEAVFAFQLAHAMAHIAERHATQFMTATDLAASGPLGLRGVQTFGSRRHPDALPAGFAAYWRKFETQADSAAVVIVSHAGYTPAAMAAYAESQHAIKGDIPSEYLPHQKPKQRSEAILRAFAELPPATYDATTGGFEEAKLLARIVR
jgi:predicted Zn-dependent protease